MAKITLDFNENIRELDGEVAMMSGKPLMMKVSVSDILARRKSEDPIKSYELALEIRNEGKVQVDSTDYDFVYKAVKDAEFSDLGRAQILLVMKRDKEKSEVKAKSPPK